MKYLVVLILYFNILLSQETVGILPVVINSKIDSKKYKKLSLDIYKELKNAVFNSYVFSLVPPKKIISGLKQLKIKNYTDNKSMLYLIAKYTGSSKLLYSEIYIIRQEIYLYIKAADSQKKEIFTNFKFLLKKDESMKKLIKQAVNQIKNSYISPREYKKILTELQLDNKIFEQILSLGGSLEAFYNIHKNYKISDIEYINILLFGGSAYEYGIFKKFGFSLNYYITYLANEFNLKKN